MGRNIPIDCGGGRLERPSAGPGRPLPYLAGPDATPGPAEPPDRSETSMPKTQDEPRTVTIAADRLEELERDSRILDMVEAEWRRAGPGRPPLRKTCGE